MRLRPGTPARLLAPAALALALAGCFQGATTRAPPGAQEAGPDPVRNQIVFTALQMVGVPYRYGGEDPSGFDCSGLVQYAYGNAGLSVPRTSRQQFAASRAVPLEEARPGDLLFFRSQDWSHVGIYLGEGRFVHAPATGRTVSIASFDSAWYRRNFVRAGRMPALADGAFSVAGECEAARVC
jgi:cell wall-associated NlpC family hydrolase